MGVSPRFNTSPFLARKGARGMVEKELLNDLYMRMKA